MLDIKLGTGKDGALLGMKWHEVASPNWFSMYSEDSIGTHGGNALNSNEPKAI